MQLMDHSQQALIACASQKRSSRGPALLAAIQPYIKTLTPQLLADAPPSWLSYTTRLACIMMKPGLRCGCGERPLYRP